MVRPSTVRVTNSGTPRALARARHGTARVRPEPPSGGEDAPLGPPAAAHAPSPVAAPPAAAYAPAPYLNRPSMEQKPRFPFVAIGGGCHVAEGASAAIPTPCSSSKSPSADDLFFKRGRPLTTIWKSRKRPPARPGAPTEHGSHRLSQQKSGTLIYRLAYASTKKRSFARPQKVTIAFSKIATKPRGGTWRLARYGCGPAAATAGS